MKARRSIHLVLLALVLLPLGGCGPRSALDAAGPDAERIAGLWWTIFGLAAAVYIITLSLLLFAFIRARRRDADNARSPHNVLIWGGGVILPSLILVVLMALTIDVGRFLNRAETAALRVEVTGHRFWWEVRYPDLGIEDANELHIPVGAPVEVVLTSEDVIHSFWVPRLTGKVDNIPGQETSMHFEAERPGVYGGQCAEFCGLQHANMAFFVIAHEPSAFEDWVADSRSPAASLSEREREGRDAFMEVGCAECHSISGTTSEGATAGPDLTLFGGRRTIGAGTVPNTRGNLGGWILNSQDIKPGNLMPPMKLEPHQLHALLDYLETLE